MPGNARETPGKHPGNTRETPGIKGAGLEKTTSLAILVGILNKEKEKNNAPWKHPGNTRETPGKQLRKGAFTNVFNQRSEFRKKKLL